MLPLISINTTAGTASEMTRFCIITDSSRQVKMAIVDRCDLCKQISSFCCASASSPIPQSSQDGHRGQVPAAIAFAKHCAC